MWLQVAWHSVCSLCLFLNVLDENPQFLPLVLSEDTGPRHPQTHRDMMLIWLTLRHNSVYFSVVV